MREWWAVEPQGILGGQRGQCVLTVLGRGSSPVFSGDSPLFVLDLRRWFAWDWAGSQDSGLLVGKPWQLVTLAGLTASLQDSQRP